MSLPDNAIAIVGLAGRFPGADDVNRFWHNMRAGITSITRFTDAELEDSFPPSIRNDPNFVRARAIVENVGDFDAEFFAMLPRQAALTDPQHRLLLECAWSALEDAGYDPARYPGAIGVFAGCSMDTYLLTNVLAERLDADRFASDYQVGSYDTLLGALSDTLATRISYKLNLRGPSMTVQSACSTSLLAISQACQSLLLYQSDMALAGGASITFPQKRGYMHQDGGMVSRDGICRPFDDDASGTIFGDGAAMVLLKRLGDAIDDGDHVYAVIRGSAVNNDGGDKVGFTAPSTRGQAEVIASALAVADVDTNSVGYVECHGTATPLGDPIEFAGLVEGFGPPRSDGATCALGSAKANIGHLDAASGVAGLIKAALALHHGEIPPLANFRKPNRHIDLAASRFYIPTAPTAWPRTDTPRRAGVSSFGVGGTNVHVVIEEAPATARPAAVARRRQVLPLSARSDAALLASAAALAETLEANPAYPLEDIAFTLQTGRRAFERRAAVAGASHAEAIAALRALRAPAARPAEEAPLVFMFPGQGAQYPGMARSLYDEHASFRAVVDEGVAIAGPIVGPGLRDMLLEPSAASGNATLLAQPALFIFEYALAKLWISWGLRPAAMVGHSVGEFVAACLADVFSFEEGCRLVATRATLMQRLPAGAMLAVRLPEGTLRAELGKTLDLAAINSPALCVASGSPEEIERLRDSLTTRGIACRLLDVSHAFHSRALDPVLGEIEAAARAVGLSAPRIPIASCVTGQWISGIETTDPGYWARHGRAPVRFADALSTAAQDANPFLLEVGPGGTLASLAAQIVDRRKLRGVAASLPSAETEGLSDALAHLWTAGFSPDWSETSDSRGRRVPLPTYRFQRSRHWIERSARPVRTELPSLAEHPAPPAAAEADAPSASEANASRLDTLQAAIIDILRELSGVDDIDPRENFAALGFDSLLLGQIARALEKKFQTRITFRQLLGDMPSVERLAAHFDATLPAADAPLGNTPAARSTTPVAAPLPRAEVQTRIGVQRVSAIGPQPLTETQRTYIDNLVRSINQRTPLSKAKTQEDRAALADPRTVAGFRREWKELVYPLIAAKAKGSKIWDIDGNEYVDLVNGYGQTMFGHSPEFVTAAVAAQLEEGFPIGPQTPLAGEVAALVAEMTGDERVTFCNTGSEAVMAAMRVARTVTGRERIVVFGNDYHGQFDEVLVRAGGGSSPRALPAAPGIPPEAIANMTVLPYGNPQSLDWIEANGHDIAAVMVEPVQSRHPALRPVAFLKRLREITEAKGAALVFDEIVTGFRTHQGGAQALFGIRADLATYGKVVGGGMPVGILAGKARFMDALDGGAWRFGDESVPEVAPTFFAGTFVRHPLVLAATKSVLQHLKAQGPALQENLAARMGGLVERLNGSLERRGLATRAEGFSSWFYVNFATEHPLASLFWPQMRLLGIHVQEAYPCFLTTAHSDADLAAIEDAFETALDALEAGGILEEARRAAKPTALAASDVTALESAPLTEPQLEILTAAQLSDEASCAFNESISITLEGDIDIDALTVALDAVVARHQALRGRVGRTDERMHFAPSLALAPPLVDLSRDADPQAKLSALLAADARQPFDLWAGPLARATFVRMATDRLVVLFTAHHIVCDGWSVNLILNDLAALYRQLRAGEKAVLPPAPGFSTYALRQASSKDLPKADLRYWVSLFDDVPSLPDLPTDRPRPAQRSYAGATYSTQLDSKLLASLKKTAGKHGATLFSLLFTALQTVYGRLSGASDIVIGVPVAGQAVDEEPDLVGHCVHMLPLRPPLVWDAPYGAHLRAVAPRLLDGFDHPRCTYGTLVRALPIERVPNRLPLMELQFNLERMAEALDFGGPTATVAPNAKAAVNFDLFVNVIESSAGLRIDCDYATDLFDAATIARWMGHYRRLLEAVCTAPETTLARLPLLSADQERFVLDTVNDTDVAFPRDKCIHDLFMAQAVKTPDAIACVDATGRLTYAELDRHSTRLAQKLLRVSGTRQGRIAVATDRSRALPIALLGVMKAGHAYVPLDVSQPTERLRQIATAAQIDGIVCQGDRLAAIAPSAFTVRLDSFDLDERLDQVDLAPVSPEASAYVLFTSGSTGTPKGVEVSHRALTNVICDVARRCDVHAGDVALASSAMTFDVAATEIYAPLISGGRVVLASMDQVRSGFDLVALATKSRATLMQATPTLWRMLIEARFASWQGLRMITAGEPVSRDVVDRLLSGGGRLWNLYGPTEATIYSSGCEMRADEAGVTIGRPLANTQLYVLDDRDQIVPLGVLGKLFIGGEGLAKGYFNRDDLTDAAFRQVSIAGRAPKRLYFTGDLARLLPSGEFELHGRVDSQIKLRGFRIEIEEIETVLRRVPSVSDCAVVLRKDVGSDPALVAYVATAENVPAADILAPLKERLPDYMVPSRLVRLEALPLTSSGKVDRNALPPPLPPAPAEGAPPAVQPATPLETRILAVWTAVLGIPGIGTRDALFSLGTDSLQVFRIAARLDQEGIAISARDLMKNPTIESLAQGLEQKPAISTEGPARRGPSLADFKRGARRQPGSS